MWDFFLLMSFLQWAGNLGWEKLSSCGAVIKCILWELPFWQKFGEIIYFPLVLSWKYIKKYESNHKAALLSVNTVWGNLAVLFLFHTFICGVFFGCFFSRTGSKVQIIVGFGDFSPAKKHLQKAELDKMPTNGGGKAPTDFEKLLLMCQRISKKCFIL